jgi:hypothetical protein
MEVTSIRSSRALDGPSLRLRPLSQRASTRPILLAGANLVERAAVLQELTHTLPGDTVFEEVGAFWEILARAPQCRMVIFSGDLADGCAEGLANVLRTRYPDLSVLSLKTPASAGA